MTGLQFEKAIKKDPSWCLSIKEPIKITTYVELINSDITHLSPLITFLGESNYDWAADFCECKNLKIATGTFDRFVSFRGAGIEKIENFKLLDTRDTYYDYTKANFERCPITYIPQEYRTKRFLFDTGLKKKSKSWDIRKETIEKIKSETNLIEL